MRRNDAIEHICARPLDSIFKGVALVIWKVLV